MGAWDCGDWHRTVQSWRFTTPCALRSTRWKKAACTVAAKDAPGILAAMGFRRSTICSHASKVAMPYKSVLMEAAVGDEFAT